MCRLRANCGQIARIRANSAVRRFTPKISANLLFELCVLIRPTAKKSCVISFLKMKNDKIKSSRLTDIVPAVKVRRNIVAEGESANRLI